MRKHRFLKQSLAFLLSLSMTLGPCAPGSFSVLADTVDAVTVDAVTVEEALAETAATASDAERAELPADAEYTASPSDAALYDEDGFLLDGELSNDLAQEPQDPAAEKEELTEVFEKDELSGAFDESAEADGVIVTVTAPEGVFPDGAELSVRRVSEESEKDRIAEAVSEARPEGEHTAASYPFDIKVLLDGEEVEPDTEYGAVRVTFSMDRQMLPGGGVSVYHVSADERELCAEALDAEIDAETDAERDIVRNSFAESEEDILLQGRLIGAGVSGRSSRGTQVSVETESFSYYVVEFTYQDLEYVLEGGSSVLLSEILDALALSGYFAESMSAGITDNLYAGITEVRVSNEELLSAEKTEGSDWKITSLEAFDTEEWMEITAGEYTVRITVTDARVINEVYWGINAEGELRISARELPEEYTGGILINGNEYDEGAFASVADSVRSVVVGDYADVWSRWSTYSFLFKGLRNAETMDLRYMDTSLTDGMYSMFEGCESLTVLDLSSFDTSRLVTTKNMFKGCKNLRTIIVGDGWNQGNVSFSDDMFEGAVALTGGAGTTYSAAHTNGDYAHVDGGSEDPGYFTAAEPSAEDSIYWSYTPFNNTLMISPNNLGNSNNRFPRDTVFISSDAIPWHAYASEIRKVIIGGESAPVAPVSTAYWFCGCSSLASVDLGGLKTDDLCGLEYMFFNCRSLEGLDLSSLNLENAVDMEAMFMNCTGLRTLNMGTQNAENLYYTEGMFYGCGSLETLDLSGFSAGDLHFAKSMFEGCSGLTEVDVTGLDVSRVEDLSRMFYGCSSLEELDLSSFNTGSMTNPNSMFVGCSSLKTIIATLRFKTDKVWSGYGYMFDNCPLLTGGDGTVFESGHTGADYANIDNQWNDEYFSDPGYFTAPSHDCRQHMTEDLVSVSDSTGSLRYLCDICGEGYGISFTVIGDDCAVTDISRDDPRVTTIIIPPTLAGYNVTAVSGASLEGSAEYTADNVHVELADSIQTIGAGAFQNCSEIGSVSLPSGLETIGDGAFEGCTSIREITVPEGIKTLNSVFKGCTGLQHAHLQDGLESMDSAFYGCTSLRDINVPNSVTNMDSAFVGCSSLIRANIPSGIEELYDTFRGCISLNQINIPVGVKTLSGGAFKGCRNLTRIVLPEGLEALNGNVFYDCTSLTTYVLPASINHISQHAIGYYWHTTFNTERRVAGVKIHGYRGTAAETYANTYNFTFIPLDTPVTGVSLDQSSCSVTEGDTFQLTAHVEPENAYDRSVIWSSSDGAVAAVDENGIVTAVGAGSAVITVTTHDGGYTANCTVTVESSAPTWKKLQRQINEAAEGTVIVLQEDYTAEADDIYLNVDKTLTIDLNGHTLDRGLSGKPEEDNGYVLLVGMNGDLTLEDGSADGGGTITGGSGTNCGGVRVGGGKLTMTGGSIRGNRSSHGGGGVSMISGSFILHGGTITENSAGTYGGGVNIQDSSEFHMDGGIISSNEAEQGGGVFVSTTGTLELAGGEITGNSASSSGGGIALAGGNSSRMTGGKVSGNSAARSGGGILVNGTSAVLVVTGGEISGNTAGQNGGGISSSGTLQMENTIVENNTAADNGGGIDLKSISNVCTMKSVSVRNNHATAGIGGGIRLQGSSGLQMENCVVENNSASTYGGGIHLNGSLTMTNGSVTGNTAGKNGGGLILNTSGAFNVSGSLIVEQNYCGSSSDRAKSNVYLAANAAEHTLNKITVVGVLQNARIGVVGSYGPNNAADELVFTTGLNGKGSISCFFCDKDYDIVLTSTGEAAFKKANPKEAFIKRLYRTCMNREADEGGLNYWLGLINSGKIKGIALAGKFVFSKEFTEKNYCNEHFVRQIYPALMGREPDTGGLAYWVSVLDKGTTREALLNRFASGTEYQNLCQAAGFEFGPKIDEPEYGTQQYGPCAVCGSKSKVVQFVERMYTECMKRTADSGGLAYWSKGLCAHTATGKTILYNFFLSKEIQNMGLSNQEYVRRIYKTMLDRDPDSGGLNYWTGRLDSGASPTAVINGFIDSKEFTKICDDYGIVRK